MKLFLIGCEYSGTTTLAHAINEWTKKTMDKEFTLIHDHFKLPDTNPHGPALTEEEVAQFAALSPRLTEVIQRHNLYYHTPLSAFVRRRLPRNRYPYRRRNIRTPIPRLRRTGRAGRPANNSKKP